MESSCGAFPDRIAKQIAQVRHTMNQRGGISDAATLVEHYPRAILAPLKKTDSDALTCDCHVINVSVTAGCCHIGG